jgi:hypothetical protein
MQPVTADTCKLRPEIVNLELPDQAAMILACEIATADIRRQWRIKHGCLVEFINGGK